jgi:hypothetical protein
LRLNATLGSLAGAPWPTVGRLGTSALTEQAQSTPSVLEQAQGNRRGYRDLWDKLQLKRAKRLCIGVSAGQIALAMELMVGGFPIREMLMRSWQKTFLVATAFCAMTAGSVALAAPPSWAPAHGWRSKGGPVPLAGAGLPVLLIAGGYALLRHRRRAKADRPQITQQEP